MSGLFCSGLPHQSALRLHTNVLVALSSLISMYVIMPDSSAVLLLVNNDTVRRSEVAEETIASLFLSKGELKQTLPLCTGVQREKNIIFVLYSFIMFALLTLMSYVRSIERTSMCASLRASVLAC